MTHTYAYKFARGVYSDLCEPKKKLKHTTPGPASQAGTILYGRYREDFTSKRMQNDLTYLIIFRTRVRIQVEFKIQSLK